MQVEVRCRMKTRHGMCVRLFFIERKTKTQGGDFSSYYKEMNDKTFAEYHSELKKLARKKEIVRITFIPLPLSPVRCTK